MSSYSQEEEGYDKTNREKSKSAKRTKTWCHNCDAALVAPGEHCSRCGVVWEVGKLK